MNWRNIAAATSLLMLVTVLSACGNSRDVPTRGSEGSESTTSPAPAPLSYDVAATQFLMEQPVASSTAAAHAFSTQFELDEAWRSWTGAKAPMLPSNQTAVALFAGRDVRDAAVRKISVAAGRWTVELQGRTVGSCNDLAVDANEVILLFVEAGPPEAVVVHVTERASCS